MKRSSEHAWWTAEPILLALLLALWLTASIGLFKAEALGLKGAPALLSISYDEKKVSLDGPIHPFIMKSRELIPEDSSIYFFNPSQHGAAMFFYTRARYILYPRSIHEARHEIDTIRMTGSDFVAVFVPRESASAYKEVRAVGALPFLELLAGHKDEAAYWAIYAVRKGS